MSSQLENTVEKLAILHIKEFNKHKKKVQYSFTLNYTTDFFDDTSYFKIYMVDNGTSLLIHVVFNIYDKDDSMFISYTYYNIKMKLPALMQVLYFIYYFKLDYTYNKVLDRMVRKSRSDFEESKYIAEAFLGHSKKKLDNCCCCYELNSIYTECKHNLCRVCYATWSKQHKNIEKEYGEIPCPMCRKSIDYS